MARLSKVILATYVAASYASFDDVSNRRKLSTDDVHGSLRRAAADIKDKKEWTTKPRKLEGDDCFPVHIDFSTAGDGSPLNHKDYVKTQWLEAYGMTVEASSTRGGYTPEGMARIFDTSVFPSEDPDLNSPNEKCVGLNGAGVGVGGEPESLGENCNPNGEGNVLIIQERDKEEPDDNAYGGSISFSFQEKVLLDRIGLLDLDMETSNFFMIERADGFSFRVNFDPLGDNSIQEETFGVEDVSQVTLTVSNSVGVRYIDFCLSNPLTDAPTTSPGTPAPTASPGTSAPTKAASTSAPTKTPITSAPTKATSTSAPTKTPVSPAPTTSQGTSAPTKSASTSAPTKTPITSAPTKSPITSAPTKTPTTSAPTPTDMEEPLRMQLTTDPTSVTEPGVEGLSFALVIKNTLAFPVTINSLLYSGIDQSDYCTLPAVISDVEYSCTFAASLSGNAVDGPTSVTVAASGLDANDSPIVGESETAVGILGVDPQMRIKKTVSQTSAEEGVVLVEVKNDSVDSDPITVFTLHHSVYGDLSQYPNCSLPVVIPPSEVFSCVFSAAVPPNTVDVNVGSVTATGFDDETIPVSASDDEVLTYCTLEPVEIAVINPLLDTSIDDIDQFLVDGKIIPELELFVEQVRSKLPLQAGDVSDVDIISSIMIQEFEDDDDEDIQRQLSVYSEESESHRALITIDLDCIEAVANLIVNAIGLFFTAAGFWGVSAGATRSIGLGVSKFLQRNSRFIRKLIVISKRNISNVRKFADAIATIFAEVSVRTLSDIIKESLSWSDYLLLFGSILLTIAGAAATGGASIAVNVASTGLALFQFIQALLKVEPACADPTQAPFLPTLPASLSPSPSGFTPEPSTFPFSSIPPSGRGPSIPPTIPPTIPPSIPPTMPPSASPSGPFPSSSPTGQPSDSPTKSPSTDPGPAPTPNDVLSSLPSESNMPSAVPTESAR